MDIDNRVKLQAVFVSAYDILGGLLAKDRDTLTQYLYIKFNGLGASKADCAEFVNSLANSRDWDRLSTLQGRVQVFIACHGQRLGIGELRITT